MSETKIDRELLERIKKLIKKGENRFEFPNVKSFVDKSVLKMLKSFEDKKEKKEK
jgi:non-homologous end joining protein Ku